MENWYDAQRIRDPRTHAIIGAAMEVHRQLGPGFLEAVYAEALALELVERTIPFEREKHLPISYKGRVLATHYRADLVCWGNVIVELKAIADTGTAQKAQVANYLKASGFETGLLLNFGTRSLQFSRLIFVATWNKPSDESEQSEAERRAPSSTT